jgi:Uma2 family endonuclease
MGQPLRKPKPVFTYADYYRWPEDERWELIDGEAYAMAAPSRAHQTVVGELFRQIANYLIGKPCQPFIAPFDVRLPNREEADDEVTTVVQPDISVICDPDKLDDRGCRGAPDWVIEVLSPSTAAKDQIEKLAVYERVGVREVWLVHPTDHVLSIYTQGENRRYGKPAIHETIGTLTPGLFPDLLIEWGLVFPDATAQPSPPPTKDLA